MKKLYAKIGKAYDVSTEPYYTLVLKYKYFLGDVSDLNANMSHLYVISVICVAILSLVQ